MASLSTESRRALVRGMGAYMKQTAATELPRSLRSIRNFNDKALISRTDVLMRSLDDDDALRARILDWLEGGPSLPKPARRVLEIATKREDGWQEALSARSQPTGRKPRPASSDASGKLEEHKRRAATAQAELKKVRAEARAQVAHLRRERDAAYKESESLKARLDRAESETNAVTEKLRQAEARAEREARRARSQTESARKKQDSLRAKLKDLRAEKLDLERRLRRADSPARKAPARGKSTEPAPPGKRKKLAVPKGLLEDARETLVSWLGRSRVSLVVDGYNVTKHEKGFGDIPLETQRDRLIAEMQSLAARFPKVAVLVVFDGSEVPPGTTRRKKGGIKVEYSKPDEIADDHIVARVEDLPPAPVVVVTSDRELQERVEKLDATVATSPQLLEVFRRA